MCNRPKSFIVNDASLDVFNPLPGHSNVKWHYIASLQSENRMARKLICDLILDTRDKVDLPVKYWRTLRISI
jgi:hypothetical protein